MRKPLLFALALAMSAGQPARAAFEVFACEPEWAALAKEIGGADVEAYSASTALQDVHKIQPRPSLIAKYRQADLAVCTGAELEIGWYPALAAKANNPKVRIGTPGYLEVARVVEMLDVPDSVDRSMGDVHAYGNPHVHTSPANIPPVAKALAERLALLDPERAPAYRARHADFSQRWSAAMRRWTAQVAPLRGVAVVSHHKSWVYLYHWLGLREVATLEPKPGVPPSGASLESVLARVREQPVKMVVHSSYEDPRAAQWLSERINVPVVELPFSVGGAKDANDLFGFYQVVFDRLLDGAGRKG